MKLRASSYPISHKPHSSFGSKVALAAPPCSVTSWRSALGTSTFTIIIIIVSYHLLCSKPNPGAWNRVFGLLFLDNPIGSGFSIASEAEEIPRDQLAIAKHLYIAITKFIELDPILFKSRPVYIAGESYAGKFVPAIGYYILKKNDELMMPDHDHDQSQILINLGGVAIGNGLIDPVTQVATHADNAYFSGLINERQRIELEWHQQEAIRLAKMRHWREATKQDIRVKKVLGVKESAVFRNCSHVVKVALYEDNMKSVKYMVELLVKRSKVLLYQGQFDLWDGVYSTEAWVKTLQWEEIGNFLSAYRKVWKVNGDELSGYVQKWGSLSHVVISRAGHLVPADQPLNSQAMIEGWILETGLFSNVQSWIP
ncbi:serine carboxypeptidase-like 50 [Prunus yedoensis var. nudiflora]|uniref:Carboxypeptidase n=1 Tax=Prunus yedoensis var. nudiflora TaxID=2094558 RepID=A0A314ZV56_PRUYE|nr:serine carboxypeptidase-like 50 [Prunus yedoensis var. nudiflora]